MAKDTSKQIPNHQFEWVWIPNKSLGPVKLGAPIRDYIEMLALKREQYDQSLGSPEPHYEVPGVDLSIYVENDLVETLLSEEVFFYKGVNLIGLQREELTRLMGREPSETDEIDLSEDDEEPPYLVYDYDGLGLQVWLLGDSVESASCSREEEES